MNTQEIVKKLAKLLYQDEGVYEGAVCFDWSSYDEEYEIPSICIDGNNVMVEEFQVNKEGTEIIITSGDDRYTLDLAAYTEQEYEEMGLYTLLNDVYYETDYSWEFGDFDTEFLGFNRLSVEIKDGVAIIPSDVTHIKTETFYECPTLKKVIVPGSVESIDEEAFFDCEWLDTVIFEGKTYIHEDCFTRCPSLTLISVPRNLAEHYKECLEEHWHDAIEEKSI